MTMKVVTVSEMRAIERETDAGGVSYTEMMERAGRGVAGAIMDWVDVSGRRVVVLVGPGNNGGDGLVAGRYLAQAGAEVAFYTLKPRADDDPNYVQVVEMGLPVTSAAEEGKGDTLHEMVLAADVVVDALLGTGVDRPIGGDLKTLLKGCARALDGNRQRRAARYSGPISLQSPSYRPAALPLVVAVDCPSGLNSDTGELDPVAVPADLTVTFAAPKIGQFLFPGATAIGELMVADIGSPDDLPAVQAVGLEVATADSIRKLLPARPLDGHKGTFGKVMIAAGSVNYTGAAALAGEGAYRAGAGLVTLAVPAAIHGPLASRLVEATFVLLPHSVGAINENASDVLLEALDGFDALLVGPGLGRDEKTTLFLVKLLAEKKPVAKGRIGFLSVPEEKEKGGALALPPLVVDADGLNLLAEMDDWPNALPANSILTPHPGEMARLLKCERDQIAADRVGVAREAAADWGHVVLLKGAFTVVAAPDGRVTLLPFANPALATAGSGDVLAGAVVALLGMGLEPYDAAVLGAFLHGAAGERAAQEIGGRGVVAGDLAFFLASVLAELEN
jgi:NAD(P)H-hydrate epimerase